MTFVAVCCAQSLLLRGSGLVDVIGWEWNCSQHITPRFTEAEISAAIRPMADELNQLRAEVAALHARLSGEA